jgi:hypothetical protein
MVAHLAVDPNECCIIWMWNRFELWKHHNPSSLLKVLECSQVSRISFSIVAYLLHARTVTLKHVPAITQQ